jgi:hypothetical protein
MSCHAVSKMKVKKRIYEIFEEILSNITIATHYFGLESLTRKNKEFYN